MKKFTLRVSGTKIGNSARPVESVALIKAPRFGLKVHSEKRGPTPIDAHDVQKRGSDPIFRCLIPFASGRRATSSDLTRGRSGKVTADSDA